MKTTLLALVFTSLISTNNTVAQVNNEKKQHKNVITIGIGQSLIAGETLNMMYDYRANNHLSIGLAGSLRRPVSLDPTFEIVPQSSKFGILNVSARILGHTGNYERMDVYGGARIGLTASIDSSNPRPTLPSLQFLSGLRYTIPNTGFGLNAELALGSPYFAAAGISYEF